LQFQIGPTRKEKTMTFSSFKEEKSFKADIGKESDTYGLPQFLPFNSNKGL
jgi:hypothetical protein